MADRTVTYRFEGDVSGLKAQLTSASTSVKSFGNDLMALDARGEKMRAGLTAVGTVATKAGLVVAAGLGFAGKAAMDWETAWTGVLKTVDGTPAQLAALESGLRSLAVETGFAHGEVAAVAEAAGQLGISTPGVEAFTRTMLDMGVSTNLSAEDAATGLARLRNIMGTTEGEIRNTGSAMVELGNNFATTEGEILAMSLRIAGAGRQAGLSTADVLGLSTAMSSVGIEAEAGGTAMSLTMKRIAKEVETGGDKLDLFARTAGMSVEEFTRAWGDDAAGTLTKFVAGLADADKMGMSTNETLRELGVTGIRESDALLRLSGNAEGLASALGTANEGFAENNALAAEAGKFYGTSAQQVKQAWAQIKDSAIDAGAAMLPVIVKIADAVAAMAGAWQNLPDGVQTAIVAVSAFLALGGIGIGALSRVVTSITTMREAFVNLTGSADVAAGATKKFFTAANAMRAGAGLLLVADQMTGLSEKAGLANTASLTLMGTMVAPGWGTAAGATVGFLLDIAAANNDVEESFKKSQAAMSQAEGFADMEAAVKSARSAFDDYKKSFEVDGGLDVFNVAKGGRRAKNWIEGLFGDSDIEEAKKQFNEISNLMFDTQQNATALAAALGATTSTVGGENPIKWVEDAPEAFERTTVSVADMEAAMKSAGPAMQNLGIEKAFADLNADELAQVADEIRRMDSEAGRLDALGDSVSGLGDDFTTTADAATAFAQALSAILEPSMNQERAILSWKESLASLNESLAENDRSLSRNTAAGRQNRGAILDRVDALRDTLNADAEAGASQEQLAKKMQRGRRAILDSAEAAGLNRGQVKSMIDQMGLTPEMVKTLFRADGAEKVKSDAAQIQQNIANIERSVHITITASANIARATAAINSVKRQAAGNADGGTIPRLDIGGTVLGQRHPYGDKVLTYLAPGEEVISNRHGQADRHRALLKAINANSLADGGMVQSLAGGGTSNLNYALTGAARRDVVAQLLKEQLKVSQQSLNVAKNARDEAKQNRQALVSAIESAYKSTLFEQPSNIWASGATTNPLATLQSDIADLKALNKARKDLSAKGVTGGALAALLTEGSLSDVQAMAGWSKADLKAYSALYSERNALASQVGSAAGTAAYGAEIKALKKEFKGLRQDNKRLQRAVNQVEKATRQAAKNAKSARKGESAKAGRNIR